MEILVSVLGVTDGRWFEFVKMQSGSFKSQAGVGLSRAWFNLQLGLLKRVGAWPDAEFFFARLP